MPRLACLLYFDHQGHCPDSQHKEIRIWQKLKKEDIFLCPDYDFNSNSYCVAVILHTSSDSQSLTCLPCQQLPLSLIGALWACAVLPPEVGQLNSQSIWLLWPHPGLEAAGHWGTDMGFFSSMERAVWHDSEFRGRRLPVCWTWETGGGKELCR